MRWQGLWPAAVLAFVVLAGTAWLDSGTRPAEGAIVAVEARPADLPTDLDRWPPPGDAPWRAFELPTRVCEVRCTTPYTAWRLQFDWAPGRWEDPAIYFPALDANAAIYLNGSLVERRGAIADPASVLRYEPRVLRLPERLLVPGRNEIGWLLVIERRGSGGVGPVYVGDFDTLARAQATLLLLTDALPTVSLGLQAACFLFALAMAVRGNRAPFLRWFLVLAPFWLVSTLGHIVPDWIASPPLRFALFHTTVFGLLAFSSLFVVSILAPPPAWMRRIGLGYFIIGTALSVGANYWPDIDGYWRIAVPHFAAKWTTFIILPFTLWHLTRFLVREQTSSLAHWVFAAALLPFLSGLHDAIRGSIEIMPFVLTPLAGVGIAAAFCVELGRRVLANQHRMARYSEELAATVRAREAELAENFRRLQVADREIALGRERRRIMQDMHDGVAGQLAALVHLANDPAIGRAEIITAVRMGLADLRLVLDSLAQSEGDLMSALGGLRERLSPLLGTAGIRLDWQIPPTLDAGTSSPEVMLGVLRILQEALHNAIRHAQPRTITVRAEEGGDTIDFSVIDDGIGMDRQAVPSGHYGLGGMHTRAASLGATLEIDSAPGLGTRIRLRIAKTLVNHENRTPA